MTDKTTICTIILTDFVSRGCSLFTDKAAEREWFRCRKHENGASDKTLVNQYRSKAFTSESHSTLYPDKRVG